MQQKTQTNNVSTVLNSSLHFLKRAAQRGISRNWIDIIVNEGRTIYKQGFKFCFLTSDDLKYFESNLQTRLKNLVVVLSDDGKCIITCYKNKEAVRNIKRKSKHLLKNNY